MTRSKNCYCDYIEASPHTPSFSPECNKSHAEEIVELQLEELEAFRLRHLENLDQKSASIKMHTSVSTYQRLLNEASFKIADSIINCKKLHITKHI